MSSPKVYTGSCLCGNIKIRVEGENIRSTACHCTTCQKWTGAMFGFFVGYKTEQVELTFSSPDAMKMYEKQADSGRHLQHSFCGTCGSPVGIGIKEIPGQWAVPVGMLEDKSGIKPTVEVFCRNRADWIDEIEGVKAFDTMPQK
ncbi:glutathione-dependent formaldehyde-activating, GFA [Xylariaceae sp. FL0016]|nr:glutathione-dependent formaldehyde-activating, GFA [Xylariaceae sp. FL0016]